MESQIALIMREALRGMAYLESVRKMHRDIKGGNILLTDDGRVKLADFGVAAQLTSTMQRRKSFIGTPYWMAPEVISVEKTDEPYNSKCDVWSLGITAIELAEMHPPLHELHPMRALLMISQRPPPQLKSPGMWSKEFVDFISKCLVKVPKKRPSARELLKHPFILAAPSRFTVLEEVRGAHVRDARARRWR